MSRIAPIINDTINFRGLDSWVDVGTGDGKVVRELRWDREINEKYAIEICDVVGLRDKLPDWNVKGNISNVSVVGKNTLVTMLDVIEHMEKEDGHNFLNYVFYKFNHFIVFTPSGFYEQEATKDNPYQEHVSGWFEEDFLSYGMRVKVLRRFHGTHDALLAWL